MDACCCCFQGTPERLMQHLVEDHSVVDPTYVEDFLLTYRTFLPSPTPLTNKLLKWYENPALRAKVRYYINTGLKCDFSSDRNKVIESSPRYVCSKYLGAFFWFSENARL
jgi:hypothetical protein